MIKIELKFKNKILKKLETEKPEIISKDIDQNEEITPDEPIKADMALESDITKPDEFDVQVVNAQSSLRD